MSESPAPSRRDLLRAGLGALGATTLAPLAANAQPPRQPNVGRIGGLINQLGQQSQWKSPELRLVRRITQGLNEAEVARVRQIGYDAYLEEQLNAAALPDTDMATRLQNPMYTRVLGFTPKQLFEQWERGSNYFDSQLPYNLLTTERAVFSRRQLQERMFEFFADHLHVPSWERGLPVIHYERTIRPHLLGSFGALTRAGMRSTAMLQYLDQVWSTRFGINENYGRELMELHTVGWDGGYTQDDVVGVARMLTGWSMNADYEFEYKANNHDFGAKSAFGVSFPARAQAFSGTAGMDEGIAFGEMLIRHPSTKRFLATKLLRWFVRPDPSEAQIQAVVNAYGAEGDIKAMLRVVLSRENLLRAPAKLKRPFHYAVSTLRAIQATVRPVNDIRRDYLVLAYPAGGMRQPFLNWPTPDGFPDRAEFWAGLIVERWNEVQNNLVSELDGPGRAVINLSLFSADGTVDGIVRAINTRIFGGEMSSALETEIRAVFRAGVNNTRVLTAVRLAISAPEFHFY